jgi:glycosyltransferase involved in cell wall biosynthesis
VINKHDEYSKVSKTILHLIDTTGPGGAETVFIQLADKLRTHGFNSLVVIRGPGWVEDELKRRGLQPIILPANGSFAFGFLLKLIRLIKIHHVDLIQSHLLGSNVYAAMAGMLTRVPVVATYHGMVDVNPNERFKALKNKVMQWGIKHYVAVSQRLLENIREQKLLDINKASVIYNGVDLTRFELHPKREIRASLRLPENVMLVGSLGNIRPAKAYHVLIEAASILIPKYPQLHFVIAGDKKASLMEKLNSQLEQLGIQNHFHFMGYIQESADFLLQMDLFALSSSSEGFSIATIEAMAAGLPVLVTRCGGPEEIITTDENGVIVEPNNAQEFAKGLEKYIKSPVFSEKMATAGKAHTESVFSLETMLVKYENKYRQMFH